MSSSIRKFLAPIHRWTGLTVGIIVMLSGLTGAAIMFRPQLEPVVNRDLLTVPACVGRAPLDTLTANAVAARPNAALDYIRIFESDDAGERIPATMIRFTDQTYVYLNPCTGAVLGERARYGGVLGTIEQIHRFRFMKNGNLIVGSSTILFGLLLLVGGLFLWWPATLRGLKHAARFNRRLPGPARTLSLHKTVGLYAGLILLSSVLTGLPQSFDWYKSAVYAVAGSAQPAKAPRSQAPDGAQRLPMQALWERAQALVPQPQEALLHYARKPRAPVEIYMVAHDAPHPNARSMLYLDAYSGKTLSFTPYADSSAGHKLYFWMLSWHTGHIGGLFGQLLLLFGALAVPVLGYTGISSYLRRRARSRMAGRMQVKVARKTVEAQDVCAFELIDPRGRALPPFVAGAHVDVYFGRDMVRQYSLCNDPAQTDRYQIAVLRHARSRGGSQAMHDEIREGRIIEIGLPKNGFPLAPSATRSLLIAGGIGITPILSMAEHLARNGADFELHYCARSEQRAAFVERLRNSSYASRVSFHFSDGPPEQLLDIGRVLAEPDPHTHVYVCGPIGFLNVVADTAQQRGWSREQVHKEYFSADVHKSESDTAFDVRLASSGKVFRVAKDKTVLEVLSAFGIDVPRSCEKGVCGTCLTRVVDGVPDHRDVYLTEAERARNDQFTPCCSRAHSGTLVLDL